MGLNEKNSHRTLKVEKKVLLKTVVVVERGQEASGRERESENKREI